MQNSTLFPVPETVFALMSTAEGQPAVGLQADQQLLEETSSSSNALLGRPHRI